MFNNPLEKYCLLIFSNVNIVNTIFLNVLPLTQTESNTFEKTS